MATDSVLEVLQAAEGYLRDRDVEAPRLSIEWMLARVLGQMQYGASVSAVGLAGGAGLPATVIPFLLRGVNLLGIDSVMQPTENRVEAWKRIAVDLPMEKLDAMVQPATLSDLPQLGKDILKGQVKGRVVVDVNA